MNFLTNVENVQLQETLHIADSLNLKYEIKTAFDKNNNVIPDSSAIYVDKNKQKKEIELFLYALLRLEQQLIEIFLNNGLSIDEISKKTLYIGCEKEYWHNKVIDYSLNNLIH